MSEENLTPAADAETAPTVEEVAPKQESYTADQVENLLSALRKTRDEVKFLKKDLKEKEEASKKFEQVNPDEYFKLQEERAAAEKERTAAEERTALLEQKYGAQAAEAIAAREQKELEFEEFRKRYALEKVFFAAGGRTDSQDGVSFFEMLADRLSSNFKLDKSGQVIVVDDSGDPVLDKETGKRIDPEAFLAQFKNHRIYGTFFKGSKGSGAGIGYGGTDAGGMPGEDLQSLSAEQLFQRAFG